MDREFLAARVDDVEAFAKFVEPWTPERASAICGVDAGLIREAARLYASNRPAMSVHGLGLTEHVQGTDAVMALVNLALLTGNIGCPGAGVNPLRGQNNVQGAAHMGCEPGKLTGATSLAAGRALFEPVWQTSLPPVEGLRSPGMMEAAVRGDFKALWAIGYDVLLTNPHASDTRRALAALDLLIVQDMFLNETARACAHVFLPACSSFEKDGTFMNAERRIQRVRRAIDPIGQSKPDWAIVSAVARAMGKGEAFDFRDPEAIWEEVRTVWPAGRGISYARLEREGLRWPCPSEDHPGTEILHRDTFAAGPRVPLQRIAFTPTAETVSVDFPFLLTTGRTRNVELRPHDVLDMAPADAARLSLEAGERVRLTSAHGSAILPLRLTEDVKSGELFATFHTTDVFLNEVTGPARDAITETPEYKVTAVRVEPA